jgi:hypothetical protein
MILEFTNIGDGKVEVKADIDIELNIPCGRCLELVRTQLKIETLREVNLSGTVSDEEAAVYSLPENVTEATPPAFLMHTVCDKTVPFRNSMEFASAMAAKERPCELALNYWGTHGMLLGQNTLDVSEWPRQAANFIMSLKALKEDAEYLNRYTGTYQSNLLG